MMNVLHEIDVNEWVTAFQDIYRLLKLNGYLLIFDVISLSSGEQPFGDSGYIFLGEKQINELFKQLDIKSIDLNIGDKSNFFIITKQECGNVSQNTIKLALESLKNDVYDELKKDFSKKNKYAKSKSFVDYDISRKYAFLSQHYINILFALERFESISP
ncbi:MAG: hypothetical protein FWG98_09970 [Candidatus Cloacimonetes bacterium]|nr:hypothetical protein [Candidatus Cloacimonadota bacterium]